MPRFRFTLRRMIVVVAILAAQFAYVRFINKALSTWGPNIVPDQFQNAPGGHFEAEEAYIRSKRAERIVLATIAPLTIVNLFLIVWGSPEDSTVGSRE